MKNYRLVYRVHQKEKFLEILRIWHGARGEPEI
ncbi:MAG TPA: type II toxin-antitoxin system RelE/ParE family toxin [Verrucomicrobiae bacterium]|nr:type II toxin-antitoxin system RelE/ParE family toxin [Verrucomicrobiae bacterium]